VTLDDTRKELIDSVGAGLAVLMNPVPVARVGLDLEESAAGLQALGICNLLLYADPDRFYENLVRSGHTRRYFLRKSRDEGNLDDFRLAISRWDSFLDVVACGHFQLARDIVALSASHWISGGEYEDDFLYRYFLHNFISPPDPQRDARLHESLTRWKAWLSGQPSARLNCCAALLAREPTAFDESFDGLVAHRQAEIAKQRKMELAADIGFEPRSQVFVEGLALLRMAQAIGLILRADYPMCPAIARAAASKPFPADIFPEIERERTQGGG
jgi:hypothetical protein